MCTDQCTDGTDCDCPPGPVVFMCKDPLATNDPFLRESDISNVVNWLAGLGGSQTIQPLMELIRNELAAVFPSATGRPVTVDASVQSLDESADPAFGRFCVKVWFLRNDKPLGVCTDDPNDFCAGRGIASRGGTYDVSPDGQRFLMIKTTGDPGRLPEQPAVVVVKNWGEELKRLVPRR